MLQEKLTFNLQFFSCPVLISLKIYIVELPGLLLSAIIVDRLGRKLSMALMLVLGCIFLFPLLFNVSANLTTAMLFGARMCVMGSFTIATLYAPEVNA